MSDGAGSGIGKGTLSAVMSVLKGGEMGLEIRHFQVDSPRIVSHVGAIMPTHRSWTRLDE